MRRMLLSVYVLAVTLCAGNQVSAQHGGGFAPGPGIGPGVLSGLDTAIDPPRRVATRKALPRAEAGEAGTTSAAGRSSRKRSR
jgi:hypothetical protein